MERKASIRRVFFGWTEFVSSAFYVLGGTWASRLLTVDFLAMSDAKNEDDELVV
jgi:hypothetical protein